MMNQGKCKGFSKSGQNGPKMAQNGGFGRNGEKGQKRRKKAKNGQILVKNGDF